MLIIINYPTNIHFLTNYNKKLDNQLNKFLKTNILQNPIKPLQKYYFKHLK